MKDLEITKLKTSRVKQFIVRHIYVKIQREKKSMGVPIVAQQVKDLHCLYEDVGSIPGLAQWAKDPVLL